MGKRIIFGALGAVALLVASGCEDTQMKAALGTYKCSAKGSPGKENQADVQVMVATYDGMFMNLAQDKTFTMNTANLADQGTWTVQRGRVVLQMLTVNGMTHDQVKAQQPDIAKEMETPLIFDIQDNGDLVSTAPTGTIQPVILTFVKTGR